MTPARWLQAIAAAIALFAILLAIIIRTTSASSSVDRRLIGSPAPLFSLHAESRGKVSPDVIALAGERGQPVLLVFMFSLCPHCLNQIEAVKSLDQKMPNGNLHILYVDSPAESPSIISAYAERLGIEAPSSPILLDPDGALAARFGVKYYPTTILIDAKGIVRQIWAGETGSTTLRESIGLLAVTRPASREWRYV